MSVTIFLLPPPPQQILSIPPQDLYALATSPSPSPHQHNVPPLFLSALSVRFPVFITEQNCSIDGEIDADDGRSWHWIAFDGAKAVAALRLVPCSAHVDEGERGAVDTPTENPINEDSESEKRTEPYHGPTPLWDGKEAYIKIGRMATLASHRGQGIAARLVSGAMTWAGSHARELRGGSGEEGWKGLVLSHAQKEVVGWWAKMGFLLDEGMGVWWEEGIEHVGMWRRVVVGGGGGG